MKVFKFFGIATVLVILSMTPGCIGDEGPTGTQGEQGLPGIDGAMFHSGDVPPTVAIGRDGDMYIDKLAATLYGPKLSGNWGAGVPLKGVSGTAGAQGPQGPQGPQGNTGPQGVAGQQGPAGVPGSKILSGNGAPQQSLGAAGDYYLEKTNGLLYGPKTTSSWGTPFNLKGPKGDKGDKGDKGPKGDKGDSGTANVIYSDWMRIPTVDYLLYYSLNVPEITQQIIDRGVVIVYQKVTYQNNNEYIIQLNHETEPYSFMARLATIEFQSYYWSGNVVGPPSLGNLVFRYVIIPGGVLSTRSSINFSNYEDVRYAFGIMD